MAAAEEKYSYTDEDVTGFMEVAIKLVKEAGDIIVDAIARQKVVTQKESLDEKEKAEKSEGNASSILTETDSRVENHLMRGLSAAFSDHAFIGEEASSAGEGVSVFPNRPTWIIDPIDGTMNFVHRNPLVCTSVGLTINRQLVAGIVNNPMTGHMYTAIKGRGAFLNGTKKLSVSGVNKLRDAMVLFELPAGANAVKKSVAKSNVAAMLDRAHAIRCPGPAALDIAWVAAGSADIFFHSGIHCWDMAAGVLLVREAGGSVYGINGEDFDIMGRNCLVAASRELAKEAIETIEKYESPREFPEKCIV